MDETIKELLPTLTSYGLRVLGALVGLWAAFRVASWLSGKVTKQIRQRNIDETLAIFFGGLTRWLVLAASIIALLGMFGIETTSFAAIIASAGLAIGLAFQGTLSNFAAGVMLLVFRPFRVGDLVNVAGQLGVVAEIGLFVCALDTLDNRRIIIPNSKVAADTIENLTANPKRRVDIDVGVSYSADLRVVRDVLEKTAAAIPGRDPQLGHQIILLELGGSSINWQVRVWCDTDAYWDVWDATVLAIKESLDAAGVEIPFPQMDVHMHNAA
ncbi:MAG: mechanosensitive ion channel [Myxococcales bacterium]|nr:mechanosensitive ion channel [Myxococcales bacterium]